MIRNPPPAELTQAEAAVQFPRAFAVIEKGRRQSLHFGMTVSIRQSGHPVADFSIGTCPDGSDLSPGLLLPWLSAGKPLTAVAVMQLVERGELQLDAPVAEVIPEFAANGKETVTLRNILTHTSGLDASPVGWPQQPWETIISTICERGLREGFQVGEQAGYDPSRSWFILGELIRRIDGRMPHDYVRQEICEPLGMTSTWMAMTPAEYEANRDRISQVAARDPQGQLKGTHSHSEAMCTAPSPGSSMRGPIHELGLFYEMLRNGGTWGDASILRPETVALMTSRQRVGLFDTTFQHTVDFGLGVLVDSNRYGAETVPYGFGRYSSERSFGHGGAQSSIGFCDPEHNLVITTVANGTPGEAQHNRRNRELNSALYRDLGLVGHA